MKGYYMKKTFSDETQRANAMRAFLYGVLCAKRFDAHSSNRALNDLSKIAKILGKDKLLKTIRSHMERSSKISITDSFISEAAFEMEIEDYENAFLHPSVAPALISSERFKIGAAKFASEHCDPIGLFSKLHAVMKNGDALPSMRETYLTLVKNGTFDEPTEEVIQTIRLIPHNDGKTANLKISAAFRILPTEDAFRFVMTEMNEAIAEKTKTAILVRKFVSDNPNLLEELSAAFSEGGICSIVERFSFEISIPPKGLSLNYGLSEKAAKDVAEIVITGIRRGFEKRFDSYSPFFGMSNVEFFFKDGATCDLAKTTAKAFVSKRLGAAIEMAISSLKDIDSKTSVPNRISELVSMSILESSLNSKTIQNNSIKTKI